MQLSDERRGMFFVLAQAALWGLFPVVIILSLASIPPLISLGWSMLFAAGFLAFMLTIRKKWADVFNPSATADILGATLILGVLYYVLFFIGLKHTSAGNASIIALSEIFFSFCFFNVWRKEYILPSHIAGAILMVIGAGIVLYPNTTTFQLGDILILIAALLAPLGNFFQRRARRTVSSESILFVRCLASVPVIFLIAYLLGENISFTGFSTSVVLLILVNGVFVIGLGKVLWIEGIRFIGVATANALGSISVLVTLFFAFFFLHDAPTVWQFSSLVPMFFGVVLLSREKEKTALR